MENEHLNAYLRQKGWFPYFEHPESGSVKFNDLLAWKSDWFHESDIWNPWNYDRALWEQLKRDGLLY